MTSRQALKCAKCGRTLPNDAIGGRCFKCVRKAASAVPESQPEPWRVGRNVPVNVYEGDRPVCQCHTAVDAKRIVHSVNAILSDIRDIDTLEAGCMRAEPAIENGAAEELRAQIAAKDDLLAEARLALRRLYNATPDYHSEVAAFDYAAGVLATLDAPDTGTQDDQVAAPVVDAIREHLKGGESTEGFIERAIREAKR